MHNFFAKVAMFGIGSDPILEILFAIFCVTLSFTIILFFSACS